MVLAKSSSISNLGRQLSTATVLPPAARYAAHNCMGRK